MYLECWEDEFWFHSNVYKWSPNIYRNYIYHLDVMQHLLNKNLYALVLNDSKLEKFSKIVGFTFLEQRNTIDGNKADIYIRSK